jgi:hypothetical protein
VLMEDETVRVCLLTFLPTADPLPSTIFQPFCQVWQSLPHGFTVTCFSATCQASTLALYPPRLLAEAPLCPTLPHFAAQAVAKRTGKNVGQVLIRWALQHGTSVIPKSTSPARIRHVECCRGWAGQGCERSRPPRGQASIAAVAAAAALTVRPSHVACFNPCCAGVIWTCLIGSCRLPTMLH